MITLINVKYSKKHDYIHVKGHANYAPKGQDLVCAGISCIMVGLCNYLKQQCKSHNDDLKINFKRGNIEIRLGHMSSQYKKRQCEKFIEMAICQLETIENNYSKFIILKEE